MNYEGNSLTKLRKYNLVNVLSRTYLLSTYHNEVLYSENIYLYKYSPRREKKPNLFHFGEILTYPLKNT